MQLGGELNALLEAVKAMPFGLIVINSDHQVIEFNHFAQNLLQHSNTLDSIAAWPKAHGMFEFAQKKLIAFEAHPLIQALAGKSVKQAEYFIRNTSFPHGRIIRLSSFPIFSERQKIEGALALFYDVSEEKKQHDRIVEINQSIQKLGYHDVLTNVLNKKGFFELAKGMLADATKNQKIMAILSLDFDHFNVVNDTLGREYGDHMLKKITHLLCMSLRKEDLISRFGSDEFVLLFTELHSPQESEIIAGRLIKRMREYFYPVLNKNYSLSLTIGIATFPENGRDIETLVKKADAALVQAKENAPGSYFGVYKSGNA